MINPNVILRQIQKLFWNQDKIMNKFLRFTITILFFLALPINPLYAETAPVKVVNPDTKNSNNTLATVNGIDVPKDLIESLVLIAKKQGAEDTPNLRKQVLDNYINRLILSQDASKLGLDKMTDNKSQLAMLKTNFLANLAISDYLTKKPINDVSIKTEYDLQVASLNQNSDLQQYKISLILVKTDEEAKDILTKIKKGDSFNQLAKDFSIEKGRNGDGSSDWLLTNQISPVLSNVIVNLSKGTFSVAPIRSDRGFYLVKLDDKRPYKIPSLDESKANIQASLVRKYQMEYISKLRKESKIQIHQ
jgi:peptidyl-prolyl cis-trans isomerase C